MALTGGLQKQNRTSGKYSSVTWWPSLIMFSIATVSGRD
jgi:hypothetical protein